jgi:hypothetical protein
MREVRRPCMLTHADNTPFASNAINGVCEHGTRARLVFVQNRAK